MNEKEMLQVYRDAPGMWARYFREERRKIFASLNNGRFSDAGKLIHCLRTEMARKLLRELIDPEIEMATSTIILMVETIIFIEDLY